MRSCRALKYLSQQSQRRYNTNVVASSTAVRATSSLSWLSSSSPSSSIYSTISPETITRRSFASAAASIKELRTLSGAPIVDCKKALAENDGDINQALDWLRQHGVAKATKKLSGREAEEGLIACAISSDNKSASIVKISSETDFAGKSETFVKLATHVAEATLTSDDTDNGVTVLNPESLLSLEHDSKSVQIMLEEAIVAIRENLGIAEAIKMTCTDENSMIVPYVHGKVDANSNAGSAASIVEISGKCVKEDPTKAQEIGKKLAMHIVAAKPLYLKPDDVPSDIVEQEKAILETQIADSKKPPEVIEKIVNGRLHKFYADVCLTEQEHMVEEGNPKVSKFLKDHGLVVTGYRLLSI